jgi:hypothetical protein
MHNGTVLDISEGGLRIKSEDSFPVRSLVSVFVQFPRQTFRLHARVEWVGEPPSTLGLSFVDPSPGLSASYKAWVNEVREAGVGGEVSAPAGDPRPVTAPPGSPAEATTSVREPETARDPEAESPAGPVRRRLETLGGLVYDVLVDRRKGTWVLTIFQSPRPLGIREPDFEGAFPDYASVDRALRDFMRTRS